MDKCEWKEELVDGKPDKYVKTDLVFKPCNNFKPSVGDIIENGKSKRRYPMCLSCKTEIHKPEPSEPLIVESGETFVCRRKDIDYLCIDPISCNGKAHSLEMEFEKMPHIWKSFKDITELTDEIALLRPIVIRIRNSAIIKKLWGVKEDIQDVVFEDGTQAQEHYRLATAAELQENQR